MPDGTLGEVPVERPLTWQMVACGDGRRPRCLRTAGWHLAAVILGTIACAPLRATAAAETSREASGATACAPVLTAEEAALARLYETSPRQRRRRMRCDPALARVARARAWDMGTRRYFKHINPDGEGPNRQVERAGYPLPPTYKTGRRANNVEVIAAGHDTAEEAWTAWVKSRHHRAHVLGTDEFFRDQTDYGVGYANVPGSRYGTYWVLISARRR